MLQRASAGHRSEDRERDEREMSTTPKPAESAVSSVSSPSAESESSAENREDQAYEAWLENVRVIEYLREYVIDRLKRKDFEDESSDSEMDVDSRMSDSPTRQPAYPALPLA